ncbi:TonB-dependent receptor plug domain-containing protein [Chitinophaga sp. 30R24]|uniref:TonB-dependent receptor plug domain-containing protein n=1 Tax=Chitinophaga sp. 30R24 TaxID=3248838 RepID=UPI003B8F97AD
MKCYSIYISSLLFLGSTSAWCQADSSRSLHLLKGVEVTANKVEMESLVSKTTMPVTVISRQTIEMMGSRRLDEVLREQTGLAVVNDIKGGSRAVGLQMQGFSSAYTMILIDGQPMVGRNAGDFDLSRITVSDIERIEIIKGASSSLFGSEALAGVVNIITRQGIKKPQGLVSVRYGSFNNTDITLEGETPISKGKGSAYLSGNYYHTDGFSVNPYLTYGATAPPYNSFTLQGRAKYAVSATTALSLTGRYAGRHSVSENSYGSNDWHNNRDVLDEGDMNLSLLMNHHLHNGMELKTQYYLTRYTSDQRTVLTEADILNAQYIFTQYLHRVEVLGTKNWDEAWTLTAGGGATLETMNNISYKGVGNMTGTFGYAQVDWKPHPKFNALAGIRYDHHNNFGGRLNPSVGIRYSPIAAITLKASLGTGFKTPDFKERYQIFTNPQQGYTVLGATVLPLALKEMQASGQISEIRPVADRIAANLKAETSVSYNIGITVKLPAAIKLDVNGFYHDVHHLINTVQVATKTNFQQVFSYMNLNRVYMTGLETCIAWRPFNGLDISVGYQLLYAKDRSVIAAIRAEAWPYKTIRNNNTGESRASVVADYFGLENRSRHMLNLKVLYEYVPSGITATFRTNYRGKYGFDDANGNRYIDQYDTYVNGYYLLFASIEKKLFSRHLSAQITVDNLLNYTDMLMPAQPGRIIMGGLSWRFFHENKLSSL